MHARRCDRLSCRRARSRALPSHVNDPSFVQIRKDDRVVPSSKLRAVSRVRSPFETIVPEGCSRNFEAEKLACPVAPYPGGRTVLTNLPFSSGSATFLRTSITVVVSTDLVVSDAPLQVQVETLQGEFPARESLKVVHCATTEREGLRDRPP